MIVAAGLVAAPALFLGQQPAGAAETTAQDSESRTFVNRSGTILTCVAGVSATHDTDVPTQPELRWSTSLGGIGCLESLSLRLTASYTDQDGITRTSQLSANSLVGGIIQGTYNNTTLSVRFIWNNCDPAHSPSCEVTVTASPK